MLEHTLRDRCSFGCWALVGGCWHTRVRELLALPECSPQLSEVTHLPFCCWLPIPVARSACTLLTPALHVPTSIPAPQATSTPAASQQTSFLCCKRSRTLRSAATATTSSTHTGAPAGTALPAAARAAVAVTSVPAAAAAVAQGPYETACTRGCSTGCHLKAQPLTDSLQTHACAACRWWRRCAARRCTCRRWMAGRSACPSTHPSHCSRWGRLAALPAALVHCAVAPAGCADTVCLFDGAGRKGAEQPHALEELLTGLDWPRRTLWCLVRACPSPSSPARRATFEFGTLLLATG